MTRARPHLLSALAAVVLLAGLGGATVVGSRPGTQPPNASRPTRIDDASDDARARTLIAYANLPLAFEANHGQTADGFDFIARGNRYEVLLSASEALLAMRSRSSPPTRRSAEAAQDEAGTVIRMQLRGADPQAHAVGADQLPGQANYFMGRDPNQWRTRIPTYQKVLVGQVYPGVDVVYYGAGGQLEYDFVVSPGADPSAINLEFEGADSIELDSGGDLLLRTSGGDVRMHKPVVYQELDGLRQTIGGEYMLTETNQVSFRLGAYANDRHLVIDPVLAYAAYLGGRETDAGFAIATDGDGNAFAAGWTLSNNFPVTPGSYQRTRMGAAGNGFIAKINPTGTALIYSTYLGMSLFDGGYAIAVDAEGAAYVTGETGSPDFPTTPGAFQTSKAGDHDAFITKLSQDGSSLVYSTFLGGNDHQHTHGIAVDAEGNAYVTGETTSRDFPTRNPFQPVIGGDGENAFVAKLNASGSDLVYSSYLGGSGNDHGHSIAVDRQGNAYATGHADSRDFPTTAGAFQTSIGGVTNAFVIKVGPTGGLLYSTLLGGNGYDEGNGIAIDRDGNAYVGGRSGSDNFPTTSGAFQTSPRGGDFESFVTKLNASGSRLIYSTLIGGSALTTWAYGIAVNEVGQAYLAGFTQARDFPTRDASQSTFGGGDRNGFVTKFNAAGSDLIYSTYLGGDRYDEIHGISLDAAGNAYVAGTTGSENFPATSNSFGNRPNGDFDAFVARIGTETRPPRPEPSPSGTPTGEARTPTPGSSAARTPTPPATCGTLSRKTVAVPPGGGPIRLPVKGTSRCLLVDVDTKALPYLPPQWRLTVDYDPQPFLFDEPAAGSLGGGNIRPVERPVELSVMVRDSETGSQAFTSSIAAIKVQLTIPVLQEPKDANQEFVWLLEQRVDGQFFGYGRRAGEYDRANNSIRYALTLADLQGGALFLPSIVTIAYVRNQDAEAHLWSTAGSDAADLGVAGPPYSLFKVIGPEVGARINVVNVDSNAVGWIDTRSVERAEPAAIAATAPPSGTPSPSSTSGATATPSPTSRP